MVGKENVLILDYLLKWSHLTQVANHNPTIFSKPPCTEKLIKFFYLNFSALGTFSAQIILTCCTCLKITFILISEQPKTSGFLVMLSE